MEDPQPATRTVLLHTHQFCTGDTVFRNLGVQDLELGVLNSDLVHATFGKKTSPLSKMIEESSEGDLSTKIGEKSATCISKHGKANYRAVSFSIARDSTIPVSIGECSEKASIYWLDAMLGILGLELTDVATWALLCEVFGENSKDVDDCSGLMDRIEELVREHGELLRCQNLPLLGAECAGWLSLINNLDKPHPAPLARTDLSLAVIEFIQQFKLSAESLKFLHNVLYTALENEDLTAYHDWRAQETIRNGQVTPYLHSQLTEIICVPTKSSTILHDRRSNSLFCTTGSITSPFDLPYYRLESGFPRIVSSRSKEQILILYPSLALKNAVHILQLQPQNKNTELETVATTNPSSIAFCRVKNTESEYFFLNPGLEQNQVWVFSTSVGNPIRRLELTWFQGLLSSYDDQSAKTSISGFRDGDEYHYLIGFNTGRNYGAILRSHCLPTLDDEFPGAKLQLMMESSPDQLPRLVHRASGITILWWDDQNRACVAGFPSIEATQVYFKTETHLRPQQVVTTGLECMPVTNRLNPNETTLFAVAKRKGYLRVFMLKF